MTGAMHSLGRALQRALLRALLLALLFLYAEETVAQPTDGAARARLLFLGNKALPPMAYLEHGRPKGIVVDLVNGLSTEMGRSIDIRLTDWSEAQQAVREGRADALIQINDTEARRLYFDFSGPLLDSTFSIFAERRRMGISGRDSLEDLRVGVERGGYPQQILQPDTRLKLIPIPTILDGFRMIERGDIDALVADEWVGQYVLAVNRIEDIDVMGTPIAVSSSAIAVEKGNSDLLYAIDRGLAAMRADGNYQRIIDSWRPQSIVYQTRAQIQSRRLLFIASVALLLLLFFAVLAFVLHRRLVAERGYREEIDRTSRKIAESELMLREVHHRIKNNMATVNGLLSLQAQNSDDARVKEALEDASNRVLTMMLLYDRLYRAASYETLSLRDYLAALVSDLVSSFPDGGKVALTEEIDDLVLTPSALHTVGVMVNELVTNTMKYAFVGVAQPAIGVSVLARDHRIRLAITDNGVGMPESVDFDKSPGFGLTLVRELAGQLGARLRIDRGSGTTVTVEFENRER